MSVAAIFAVILMLATCVAIVGFDNRAKQTKKVEDYLFAGNNPVLAISSGIGSIFSLSISCTAFLSGGFIYGWQILIPFYLGIVMAFLTLAKFVNSQSGQALVSNLKSSDRQGGATQFILLAANGRAKSFFLTSTVSGLFFVLMLTTEIAVARVFLGALLPVNSAEVVMILVAVVAICFIYVFMGGLRGVLLTDHFQILVILVVCGVLAGNADIGRLAAAIPGPTVAVISWTDAKHLAVLHGSLFLGTVMLISGSVDQWVRTVGTLDSKVVVPTIGWSYLSLAIGTTIPILLGATAHRLMSIPPGVTNTSAILMVRNLLSESGSAGIFLASVALACITMTTIDTYIISIQQIYYEISIRIRAKSHWGYLFEYLLKWRQVRLVSALAIGVAFCASFAVADEDIYFFGVLALSGPIFTSPVVFLELLASKTKSPWLSQAENLIFISVATALAVFWPLLRFLERMIGDVNLHLYLILGSAALSSIFSFALALIIGVTHRRLMNA